MDSSQTNGNMAESGQITLDMLKGYANMSMFMGLYAQDGTIETTNITTTTANTGYAMFPTVQYGGSIGYEPSPTLVSKCLNMDNRLVRVQEKSASIRAALKGIQNGKV